MTMMILYDHAAVVAVTVVVRICQKNDNHSLAAIVAVGISYGHL